MSSQKYGLDPESGIRKKLIPDPGSRGQKSTGFRIRIHHSWQLAYSFFSARFTLVEKSLEIS
jgi:hypothetical protein